MAAGCPAKASDLYKNPPVRCEVDAIANSLEVQHSAEPAASQAESQADSPTTPVLPGGGGGGGDNSDVEAPPAAPA